MEISVEDCVTAISRHTHGLAEAAAGNLDRRIEHCPAWSMADLVWHLTGVHRFWNHIATELPAEAPELPEVQRPADEDLIPGMLAAMETMVATLQAADQTAACWTWGQEESVWFITRHQVQEAAVHHWDAVNASGSDTTWSMEPLLAMDAVEEFLTHSVANPRWPMADAQPMGGTLWFCPCADHIPDCPDWRMSDGELPGTVAFVGDPEGEDEDESGAFAGNHGHATDFLLWLYRRYPDDKLFDGLDETGQGLVERFRALTSTD